MLHEVHVGVQPLERYESVLGRAAIERALDVVASARRRLAGRVVWNVNSTATGGGVAELLGSLLPYVRGAEIDARWMVIDGPAPFFAVTKRLHNALHGVPGEPLGEAERTLYEETLRANAVELGALVRPGDIAIAHDPQTAGLIPYLVGQGARVIWRCHVGHEHPDEVVRRGWEFLAPYLEGAHAFVFSHEGYSPSFLPADRTVVLHPTIDAFSAKNRSLSPEVARAILVAVGIVEGPSGEAGAFFPRLDGSPGRVDRAADVVRLGRPPRWDTPLVVQVSRWDRLKDPIGVMAAFARVLQPEAPGGAELVLAGPNVSAVADDPEGASMLDEVVAAWRALPHAQRRRVHVVSLPMVDVEENAIIVNALQRHAAVVVQKSLREGFGLTVTEAMWKARPVVASAVGGIPAQVRDGRDGLLLPDPSDLDAAAAAITRLLTDATLAARLGESARERVRDRFLGIHTLLKYAELIERLDDETRQRRRP
jgi:trehalose synthase